MTDNVQEMVEAYSDSSSETLFVGSARLAATGSGLDGRKYMKRLAGWG
jgi:hypothetical protein